MTMIHPLFKVLLSEPGLLAEHASAYLALASSEAQDLARRWQQRVLGLALAAVTAALALGLTGVAALLAAALPVAQMPQPALLWALPGGLWLAAGACLWWARAVTPAPAWALLREQWQTDQALLAQAGERA